MRIAGLVTRGRVTLGRGTVVTASTEAYRQAYRSLRTDLRTYRQVQTIQTTLRTLRTLIETPIETPNRYSRTARLAVQVKDKGKVQTLLWRVSLSSSI